MNNDIDQMHYLVLHMGEAHCERDWNYKNVCSPFTRIFYVTQGNAQIEFPDRLQELRPGFMYIIPAFTPHSYICRERFSHYYIHIYNESDHDILEDWILPTEIEAQPSTFPCIQRLHALCPGMELQHYEPQSYDNNRALERNLIKNKQRELSARIESRSIIYYLLAHFMRSAQPKQYIKDERVAQVLNYIRANLGCRFTINDLSDRSCMSKDHLIRIFKKEMKTTPLNYINQKKIERAQLRLITGIAPVKEIAYQLGFDDQGYFNRLFKKITGVTPMHYRRIHQAPGV